MTDNSGYIFYIVATSPEQALEYVQRIRSASWSPLGDRCENKWDTQGKLKGRPVILGIHKEVYVYLQCCVKELGTPTREVLKWLHGLFPTLTTLSIYWMPGSMRFVPEQPHNRTRLRSDNMDYEELEGRVVPTRPSVMRNMVSPDQKVEDTGRVDPNNWWLWWRWGKLHPNGFRWRLDEEGKWMMRIEATGRIAHVREEQRKFFLDNPAAEPVLV
jgi:hypothetical protein